MDEGNFAALGFVRTEEEDDLVSSLPLVVTGYVVVNEDCYINGDADITGDIIIGGEIAAGVSSAFYLSVYIENVGATNNQAAAVVIPFGGYLHTVYGVVWGDVGVSGGNIRLVLDTTVGEGVSTTAKPNFDLPIPDDTLAGVVLTPTTVYDDSYLHFVAGDSIRLQVENATTNAVALTIVLEAYRTQR